MQYLDGLLRTGELATHPVVVAEVLTGARNRQEQEAVDVLFSRFKVIELSADDVSASLDLVRAHRLRWGVGWLDCLIAATALRMGLPVAALNIKHFSVLGDLILQRPY